MTSKLTRERIELIANFHRAMALPPSHAEIEELARIALAAMDSEPVAEVLSNRPGNDTSTIDRALPVGTQLYRHARPAPASPVCSCPSGDGSLRWPCPVHPGNSPAIPDSARDALEKALAAMEFMGDTLNNLDAVCTEDVELVAPAFDAVRSVLAAALQEGK